MRDISKIFAPDEGFSRSGYFGMGSAQLFESAHMHLHKNHTLNIQKNRYYLATKNIFTFSNISIIN